MEKENRKRMEEKLEWFCPACAQGVRLPARLARHMISCCPELCAATTEGPVSEARAVLRRMPSDLQRSDCEDEDEAEAKRHEAFWKELRARPNKAGPLTPGDDAKAKEALAFAEKREEEIRRAASFIAFHLCRPAGERVRGGDNEDEDFTALTTPVTLPLPERIKIVRKSLSLSEKRLDKLLKLYIRSEPLVADDQGLDVIYEDEYWLCANKPPFVRTAPRHRFEGNSMVNRAIGYVRRKRASGEGQANPHVLHRLDMDTSGVLLYSKDKDLCAFVQTLFRERRVKKHYLAICCGNPPDHFIADSALERKTDHEIAMKVTAEGEESEATKPSKTLFVTIARSVKGATPAGSNGPYSLRLSELHPFDSSSMDLEDGKNNHFCLICAIPLTGRTHQIRLHVADAGFPIIGDTLYGMLSEELMERQALHAFKLKLNEVPEGVPDPSEAGFLAPLPQDMASCLAKLGIDNTMGVEEIETIVQTALSSGAFD
ncbi:pseudouridine synthase [Chloropicon primus]|uniref:Pseudouridine synthase n=2 Tax=Chloropicon primus TaxID=1764295 RepID=A0A5B8N1K8_9CHLO|nr:pseudouridine synthase [Chloropicon primus]UPR04960.1 pseudouridine synthase [Chloropicon primus]|eukprot:QDZ25765.1 pseudouridine synthase [Chloropicon primus]